jgi:hypothetical protein
LYSSSGFLNASEAEYHNKKKTFTYGEKSEVKRAEYNDKLKRVPYEKRVYIDESGVHTYLQREYARAPRGEIVEDVRPGRKFERVNVIGAFCEGTYYGIECYNQSTDSEFFENWFENNLLKELPKGYTVIMDNASFHNKSRLRKLARGKIRLLFLPPYSPDYNPIEKSWANMKRFLRSFVQNYQSVDDAIHDYFEVPVN